MVLKPTSTPPQSIPPSSPMADYVPSDSESLLMLRSAALALELTVSELRANNRELSLAVSELEATVSRLASRQKKKKKAGSPPKSQ